MRIYTAAMYIVRISNAAVLKEPLGARERGGADGKAPRRTLRCRSCHAHVATRAMIWKSEYQIAFEFVASERSR
jgi:hypothetical protein